MNSRDLPRYTHFGASAQGAPATGAAPRRRTVLKAGALGAAATGTAYALGSSAIPAAAAEDGSGAGSGVFRHGVASGDPLADRVMIWTRVTPSPDATPGSGLGAPTPVEWEMARDENFGDVVAAGSVVTSPDSDHTVNLDATGLAPDSWYFFRFRAAGQVSPVGRTRTAPAAGAATGRARFGVVSCSNWEAGYFAAYRHLAARGDLDAVIELGDYIYEYGAGQYGGLDGSVRTHEPAWDIVSLADYRQRLAQYRTDPDLQALHARVPWICTWDDHEVANDAWANGAENHRPEEGSYSDRKRNSSQAYFEWLPVRPQNLRDGGQMYRRLGWGSLAEINMLDLRSYRDEQAKFYQGKAIDDPGRTMTGAAQFDWLTAGLKSSTARWNLVGNSVMITPVLLPPLDPRVTKGLTDLMGLPEDGVPYNADQWDGYSAERRRLFDTIHDDGLSNCVFLTGDIHTSWACDLPWHAGTPTDGLVGAEFVVPSVTSANINESLKMPEGNPLSLAAQDALPSVNHHVRFVDLDRHGFGVFEITEGYAHMDYFALNNVEAQDSAHYRIASWRKPYGPGPIEAAGPLS
ncbi:alkaline phosphatase D family protein [Dietzia sp.]|uniref:alkaline phosphatase D family protein n=1 Tax=Dietzia sp. TaxID=1871616 RepID=UPI002FDB7F93